MRRINKYEKKHIYKLNGLNLCDIILITFFPNYSFKIYSKGYKDGFNFGNSTRG